MQKPKSSVQYKIIKQERDMEVPCPSCELIFSSVDNLLNHALQVHRVRVVANIIEDYMILTKDNFTQVDSQWIFVLGSFHLSITPDEEGKFRLMVYGSVDKIPSATQYPSEPEWEKALELANKFAKAYGLASRSE